MQKREEGRIRKGSLETGCGSRSMRIRHEEKGEMEEGGARGKG